MHLVFVCGMRRPAAAASSKFIGRCGIPQGARFVRHRAPVVHGTGR